MAIYSEYLSRNFDFESLTQERKKQLRRIAELRDRDILVIAADLSKGWSPISIMYSDVLPITDQLAQLSKPSIDVILETPGGSGETAEDIVRLLHGKYEEVGIIVPGVAKSAGTIIAMAGDEILMEAASSLGPIDAQLSWQGKVFSADALIEGMDKIKAEVERTGQLNRAYVPILQNISPGELQSAENALEFARKLVKQWLVKYKFKTWNTHSTTGSPVTEVEKMARAEQIAHSLCDHRSWLTHNRSIKIDDLQSMGLKITDYSQTPDLADAIRRYHTLLQMTFESNIYKVFETIESQIFRFSTPTVPLGPGGPAPTPAPTPDKLEKIVIDLECHKCKNKVPIQANLGIQKALESGNHRFPKDNRFRCLQCKVEHDLSDLRRQIESQTGKRIV